MSCGTSTSKMTNFALPENNPHVEELRKAFLRNSDPENAVKMSAYMKDQFPFFGIPSPRRKELIRELISGFGYPRPSEMDAIVRTSFQENEREFHYFAVDIMSRKVKKLEKESIQLAEWMIVNKSWWDTVDAIATNIIGPLLRNYPELRERSEQYLKSDNMWLRRTAILHQLKYKEQTDRDKLFRFCCYLAHENEFFIKKAIGWALREYSKTQPDDVIQFVNKSSISAFSKREALKWINKKS